MDARTIIEQLGLEPHPEGGHFRPTWRDPDVEGRRGRGSAILYLLGEHERSRWHRLDAVELWHWYRGAPLKLSIASSDAPVETVMLGPDYAGGQRPQAVVPAGAWQSARSVGAYTLAGCTVTPAFTFDGFELAPEGWEPKRGGSRLSVTPASGCSRAGDETTWRGKQA